MFEKEAEEKYCKGCKLRIEQCLWAWRNTNGMNEPNEKNCSCKEVPTYIAGAEFGYNKANEWHYVKDGDLPNTELEEKQLLIRVRNYTEDYIFAYYMKDKYYSKNGKRFYSDTDCDYPIDIEDIIAWKEIVLPELKESE